MDLADLSALMGEEVAGEAPADIWVVLPGEYGDLTHGHGAALLAAARRLADGLGCYVHAVVEDGHSDAIAFGADRVHITDNTEEFLAGQHPEFVLLPAGCGALAAGLAQAWGAGLITEAREVTIDPERRDLVAAHPVYGGEYELTGRVTSPVKMATVQLDGLPRPAREAGRTGEVIDEAGEAAASRVRDLGPADFTPPAWRALSKARVIVAVGRGVQDAEGVALAARLAARLGAELAGDRAARDAGWVDAAHEVGVTAEEVAPELYVAVGVLGDTVHNAAIVGARRVVAIHSNAAAPIFAVADVAVRGEVKEVLRELIERLG